MISLLFPLQFPDIYYPNDHPNRTELLRTMRAEVLLTLSAMGRGVRQTAAAAVTWVRKPWKIHTETVENDDSLPILSGKIMTKT
jgi:hypothetical protein